MRALSAEFVTSAARAAETPRDGLPQVALVGRSNVGKSTLINALTRRRLARTSAKPGKTRLANVYRITGSAGFRCYLVDLPGYGYARGGDASRREFAALADEYFALREQGRGPDLAVLVVDARHPAIESDIGAREWLLDADVPTLVAANKVDKLSRAERARMAREHAVALTLDAPLVEISAGRGEGLDELWQQIAKTLKSRQTNP